MLYCNAFQEYELEENEILKFIDSPFYKQEKFLDEKIDEVVLTLSTDNIKDLLQDHIIEIEEDYIEIMSKPKLYKFKINGRIYSDVFFNYKILKHKEEFEGIPYITIYKNYHGFDGNMDILDSHFFVESVVQLNNKLEETLSIPNVLFDPIGEVVDDYIENTNSIRAKAILFKKETDNNEQ